MCNKQLARSGVYIALLTLCFVVTARAQQSTATLVGTVYDPSHAVIGGATITATRLETNQNFTTATSSTGDYALPSLPEGQYTVTAAASGFSTLVKNGLTLSVGQTMREDFNLAVGAAAQVAEVTEQAPALETTNASIAQVISPHVVAALPLNQRDIVALATLAPGVLPPRGQVAGGNMANGGFVVRGRRRSDNVIFLNGAMITQGNGADTFLPNVDAIQEFQIKSGLYEAQYGIMDGGQLVVVTKSGGNHIHGDAFEYFRNNGIAASNFFQPVKPSFNRNDYGGTFGGPVYIPKLFDGRDKAWFFVSLERVSTDQYLPLSGTMPTDAQKQGVFATPIIDPSTGMTFSQDSSGNYVIPSSRINTVAQQFLQFWPEPNTQGSVNYFSTNTTENFATNQLMIKGDYRQNAVTRWWAQYIHDSTPAIAPATISRFSLDQPLTTTVASLGRIDTFHGKYVSDLSVHWFIRPYYETASAGANCTFTAGLNIPQLLTTQIDKCGVPTVNITGFTGVGDTSLLGAVNTGTWWLPWTFSFQEGKHFLEAGFIWRRQFNLYDLGQRSSFTFSNIYSGNGFANFLLGLPTSTTFGGQSLRLNQAMNTFVYWAQDAWRVTPKLTLNLGVRWEDRMPLYDKRGWSANFDPTTDSLYPALQNLTLQTGEQGRFVEDVPLVHFSQVEGIVPRIGFAYHPTDSLVVRGGYGIFASEPVVGEMQNLGTNPRPGATQLQYINPVSTPAFTLYDPFPTDLAGQAIPSAAGLANPFKLERSHEWGLSIQSALSPNWVLELTYDGSHTQNVIEQLNLNDAPPGAGAVQARRPHANFAGISWTLADADSHYNGMDVRIEKRPSQDGLTLLAGLGWSKAIDDTDSRLAIPGENTGRSVNMPLYKMRALSSSNIGLRFIMSIDYQLPFGKGRAFATQGLASKLAGGWSLQNITTVQSGPWFTVFIPGDPANTGDASSQWPDLTCNPNLNHSKRNRQLWFDTNCFAKPAAYTYGNAGRSTVQGPGIVNADLALHRTIAFTESQNIELRFETFNLFNHPNFGLPGASYGVAGFGTISSALDPRQIQLGFKYVF